MQEKTRAIRDGVAYRKMGDYDKAISCYTEAIQEKRGQSCSVEDLDLLNKFKR